MMDSPYSSSGREILSRFLSEHFKANELISVFDDITALYKQVNSVINISSLRTDDDIYIKHYLDSIIPYNYFTGDCCDVGCGGGFPTIPIAVVTGSNVLGIDGVGKKLRLIELCKSALDIDNLDCEHIRAEELARKSKKFDTVCARAVAETSVVLSYCAPLCKPGGSIVLYKTPNDLPANEKTLKKFNVTLFEIKDYFLPETTIRRRLFIYKKNE